MTENSDLGTFCDDNIQIHKPRRENPCVLLCYRFFFFFLSITLIEKDIVGNHKISFYICN